MLHPSCYTPHVTPLMLRPSCYTPHVTPLMLHPSCYAPRKKAASCSCNLVDTIASARLVMLLQVCEQCCCRCDLNRTSNVAARTHPEAATPIMQHLPHPPACLCDNNKVWPSVCNTDSVRENPLCRFVVLCLCLCETDNPLYSR
jgi:hypothetical protein